MSTFKIKDAERFCDEFLRHYVSSGFVRMSKRDIDVLVMYLLISDGQFELPKDIFDVSRKLCLTEARVRNLYQVVQLRYQQLNEENAKKSLVELIETRSFEIKEDRIMFFVRDPMLAQWIQNWVYRVNGITDSSFNQKIISIKFDVFKRMLNDITLDELPPVKGELAELNNKDDKKSKLDIFFKEFVSSAGKEAGSAVINTLVTVLKVYLGL